MKPLNQAMREISPRRKLKMALYPFFLILCSIAVIFAAFSGSRKFDYIITNGSDTYTVSSYSQNVETVLEETGFSLDAITYEVNQTEDGISIVVCPSATVSVTCDGQTSFVATSGGTVGDVLSRLDITLGEDDIISVPISAPVTGGMNIEINRVQVEYTTVDMEIQYLTSYVENAEMDDGNTQVITEGKNGLKRVTYQRTSVDGVLQDFYASGEEIVSEPVNAVISYGTHVEEATPVQTFSSNSSSANALSGSSSGSSSSSAPAISEDSSTVSSTDSGSGTITTSSGATLSYSRVLNMTATAYTYSAGANITSSGAPAQVGIVAALPSTLPEGTQVYIVSPYGSWEYGVATVGDRPTNDVIDLFMETYDECVSFGVRDALVYVLN